MSKVIFNMSVSLDGFVAGPNDEVDKLFSWYGSGDTDVPLPETSMVFEVSRQSAEYILGNVVELRGDDDGLRNLDFNKARASPHRRST